jgi:Ca-activated chloride channel homolog
MTFLWSPLLVLLAALPLLVLIRVWALRRPRTGVRFSSLSLVREATPRSSWIRRHLPFALFVVGLGSLVLAMARPAAIVAVPTSRTTVVLAMDVSRSMCATDIEPNRLIAAEEAASSFVLGQDGDTQIGIVAFARFAEIVQVPTDDEEALLDIIASLATGRGTAVGSAILKAIDAIAEIDPSVARSVDDNDTSATPPPSVPKGAYAPAMIVLLTDGASNTGPDPVEAAQQAAARGLRVYTIGFGTENPGGRPPRCGAQYVGREPNDPAASGLEPAFGGGFGTGGSGTGGGFRRAIDEDTLIAVAEATGGKYFPAQSADQLTEVFEQLPTDLIVRHEVMEISVAFTAVAVVLVGLAILLGQAWRPLP